MTDEAHAHTNPATGAASKDVGRAVIFTDTHGVKHNALVTAVWGELGVHSINLLFVEDDPAKTDQYGRQINRQNTSVVHKSGQSAHGMYYEVIDAAFTS
jgi:hypothetical protein